MQRQRNIFDMFPENVDLNQGPSYNGLDMTGSDECNSRLSPNERRLLSNEIAGEKSYSSWDVGESSSRPNVQNHVANNNNNKEPLGGQTSKSHDSRFRERQFDHQRAVGALNSQNAGSGKIPMDVDLNLEYRGTSSNEGGPSRADVEASSSGTSNERGTSSSFGNNPGQSSLIVNSREPTVRESSHRHFYQGSTNSSQRSTQQPPSMPVPGMPRNLLPFPFISNVNSRNGSSTSSGFNQDNSSSGRSNISGVNGQSSSRNATFMLPNLNSTTNDQQISNDIPPWTLFPYLETESGGHRGPFRNFPSGPSSSSSEENVFSSSSRNQPRHHQPSLRLEVFDDEWQALGVDLEGRNRLVSEVRQILSVLRRSENFNAEDYMLDPVINGVADLHDRHRDMRLDVDNMSYEELLALGERIGDVKTGLTEDVISKSLKQRKHLSFMAITTQNFEPCCICQEEYKDGEDVGKLDCGHEFHTCCIKQWLTQKNLCPICKMPGLST